MTPFYIFFSKAMPSCLVGVTSGIITQDLIINVEAPHETL